MSQFSEKLYKCPHCGRQYEIVTYDTVNAEESDLRDRCVSGEIFKNTCPTCHKEYLVQNTMLYMDREHKFVLYLSDEEAPKEIKDLTQLLAKAGFKSRRCTTVAEFAEKIMIFEDGVDDVLVELARMDCLIEFVDNKKGNAEDITSIEYQRCDAGVMKINVRTDDKGLAFMIPVSFMEEELDASSVNFDVDDASLPVVNAAWLTELFAQIAE